MRRSSNPESCWSSPHQCDQGSVHLSYLLVNHDDFTLQKRLFSKELNTMSLNSVAERLAIWGMLLTYAVVLGGGFLVLLAVA